MYRKASPFTTATSGTAFHSLNIIDWLWSSIHLRSLSHSTAQRHSTGSSCAPSIGRGGGFFLFGAWLSVECWAWAFQNRTVLLLLRWLRADWLVSPPGGGGNGMLGASERSADTFFLPTPLAIVWMPRRSKGRRSGVVCYEHDGADPLRPSWFQDPGEGTRVLESQLLGGTEAARLLWSKRQTGPKGITDWKEPARLGWERTGLSHARRYIIWIYMFVLLWFGWSALRKFRSLQRRHPMLADFFFFYSVPHCWMGAYAQVSVHGIAATKTRNGGRWRDSGHWLCSCWMWWCFCFVLLCIHWHCKAATKLIKWS